MPFLATMPSFMLFKEGAQLFHWFLGLWLII
jgi:hypothetical protein